MFKPFKRCAPFNGLCRFKRSKADACFDHSSSVPNLLGRDTPRVNNPREFPDLSDSMTSVEIAGQKHGAHQQP